MRLLYEIFQSHFGIYTNLLPLKYVNNTYYPLIHYELPTIEI